MRKSTASKHSLPAVPQGMKSLCKMSVCNSVPYVFNKHQQMLVIFCPYFGLAYDVLTYLAVINRRIYINVQQLACCQVKTDPKLKPQSADTHSLFSKIENPSPFSSFTF